ncbi:MAG: hypothetical protein JRC92_11175, partial [Deltaproteobacteria bacterium]|nr:hypothetical protein [Deltaproteobacteria bacterium]
WCGETHLQKAAYFLQDMLDVPLGFDFILYKHGPFSFDLRDELTALRADGLLELEIQPVPYGPKLATTKRSQRLRDRFPKTIGKYEKQMDFVAGRVAGKNGVVYLERLGAALYVSKNEQPGETVEARVKILTELKPHISEDEAQQAMIEIDRLIVEARNQGIVS